MKLGWCVSGQGMAMRAVVAAHRAGLIESEIVAVVTDRPTPVAAFCKAHGIAHAQVAPAELTPHLIELRERCAPDWLGLTFNRLLAPDVITAYRGQILNLHMSLLPLFPGFGPTQRALDSGMRLAGATVHLIDAGVDTGPIVGQAVCPILPDDTAMTLGKRQFDCAVPLVIQIVRSIERGDLRVTGSKVAWLSGDWSTSSASGPSIDPKIARFAVDYCATI